MATLLSSNNLWHGRSGNPVEHGFRSGARLGVGGRDPELDERDEPPVGTGPFAVRVDPESAVSTLPAEEPGDHPLAPRRVKAEVERPYSHSMVPGGFDVMSNTTRLTPLTSLTIRLLMRPSTSYGTRAQSAVIASSLVTTRIATTFAYVR